MGNDVQQPPILLIENGDSDMIEILVQFQVGGLRICMNDKVTVVKAIKPYLPKYGDLVCAEYAAEYLENPPTKLPKEAQVLPLGIIEVNPWVALDILKIDVSPIKKTYKCPYTNYEFYGVVPIAHGMA